MPSLTVTKFRVIDGAAHIQFSDGDGTVLSQDAMGDLIKESSDKMEAMMMLSMLIVRADRIDPTRGAAFRAAILNHTLTVNFQTDNIMVRT